VQFETSWLRFAPFTSSGLIIAAAVFGGGSQILNGLGLWERLEIDETAERLSRLSILLIVPAALVGMVVVSSVLAVVGYLVTNYGFTLTYTRSDHAWHLRRGLLTTRETSMDATRLRGVSLGEPLGLRLVSGARLSAIVTGLDRDERGSGTLVPPAPRDLVAGVATQVLGATEPVTAPLVRHGEAATRRRYVRALVVPALVTVAVALLVIAADAPWETVLLGPLAIGVGLVLAADRAHTLGHALVAGHLVARAGSLVRRRVALDTQAVIGWNFADTWFQRRAGLTTLVATMAGGRQSVTVLDVPDGVGTALARDAVPGLVEQFLREDRPPRRVLQVPAEVPEADS
jgi:putative membrane protein